MSRLKKAQGMQGREWSGYGMLENEKVGRAEDLKEKSGRVVDTGKA